MDGRAGEIANQVSQLLFQWSSQDRFAGKTPYPMDEFAYGSAVAMWERKKKPPRDFFSTEDPWLLNYAAKLTLLFGLPVLTREEADARKADRTIEVHEGSWLEEAGIINPFDVEGGGGGVGTAVLEP